MMGPIKEPTEGTKYSVIIEGAIVIMFIAVLAIVFGACTRACDIVFQRNVDVRM